MNLGLYGWSQGGQKASANYKAAVLADNPLLYFRLGETTGTVEYDSSPYAANATYGGTITTATGVTADGNAAQVFSNSVFITLASTLTFAGDFALEFWLKESGGMSNSDAIFGVPLTATNVNCFGNQPRLFTGGDIVVLTAGSTVFQHYVITRSGSTVTGYVNGGSVATGTYSSSWTLSRIAQASCTLDEIAIYGTALSSTRVSAHYKAVNVV